MKIALSGVSGSGKTTLLPIIAEKLGYRKNTICFFYNRRKI
jgi:cytidylate kinase